MYSANYNQEVKTVEPDKKLKEILDTYAEGRHLSELTKDEVDDVQKKLDAVNSRHIDEYLEKGTIDEYTAGVLHNYFDDGMKTYDALYTVVTQTHGEPEEIFYENIDTGEVDTENSYYLQHIAPFTSMTMKYTDEHGNPYFVKLGKLKSLARVIEKIAPSSEYDKKYKDNIKTVWAKFGDNPENTVTREAALAALPRPVDMCNDILRCIVSPKYAINVYENIEKYKANPNVEIREEEIKDKFGHNDLTKEANKKQILKSPGNHRDFKFIARLAGGLKIEIMGMTQAYLPFYKATHRPYELRRSLERMLPFKTDYVSNKIAQNQIAAYNNEIRQTYGAGFEQENRRVLDKVKRMEDKARRKNRKPDEKGTYPECVKFIVDNYYPRTVHALSLHSFDGLPRPLQDVACRYFVHIQKKHLANIRDYEKAMLKKEGKYHGHGNPSLTDYDSEHAMHEQFDKYSNDISLNYYRQRAIAEGMDERGAEISAAQKVNTDKVSKGKEDQIASMYQQLEEHKLQQIINAYPSDSKEVEAMYQARSHMPYEYLREEEKGHKFTKQEGVHEDSEYEVLSAMNKGHVKMPDLTSKKAEETSEEKIAESSQKVNNNALYSTLMMQKLMVNKKVKSS